ncbi:MAG: OadG family protein [Deltaproteobacteria bacterium]|nr:OadG family protein [Deltaproteobacteria bacterium]
MFGFEAIIAHDGLGISVIGISIVFVSLILLSFAVSRIHKLIGLWDKRSKYYNRSKKPQQKDQKTPSVLVPTLPQDVQRVSRQFKLLIEWMGEPFPLPKLLDLSGKCGLSHPHSTINEFIKCELIIPAENGYYILNKQVEEKILLLEEKRSSA